MNIKELIKGIVIGIAKIVPGFSGAVVMISFNLYDRAIEAITNFFDNPKKNFYFLFNISVGVIIGIVLFSKVTSYFLKFYYLYTMMFFIGLILGGIPILKRQISNKYSNYLLIILSFSIMYLLGTMNINHTYIPKNSFTDILVYFVAGVLEAIGTVLPGVSSTALLMLLGVYSKYIEILANILTPTFFIKSFNFIFPFFLGMFLGIISITLLVDYLFKHYKEKTFSIILGVSFSSVFVLFVSVVSNINSIISFIISLIFLIVGYFLTSKLS